ncbi:hypothetical protein CZ774_02465 [Frigoribacterium sp. JB110]|nr:hypothetical protein CZ774_02465 [Frigoribacterium sp. JB110]
MRAPGQEDAGAGAFAPESDDGADVVESPDAAPELDSDAPADPRESVR